MVTGRGKALILLAVGVGFASGCGARTDTLFDEGGGGALGGYPSGGDGATSGFASAGYTTGGYGNVSGYGGSVSFSGYGGSISFGGGPIGGFGSAGFAGFTQGGFHAGGSGSAGAPFGGFSGSGGAAGAPFGGFGGVAGTGAAGAGGSGGIVELCVGAAQTACDKCVCSTCGSQLNACFTDIGCALIFACVQEHQCGLDCYQNATCRGVIDQFGGLTGSAVNEVFSLASCSVTTRPGCGCN